MAIAKPEVHSFRATPQGFTCVIDSEPHEFADSDVAGLRVQKERLAGSGGPSRTREVLSIRLADDRLPTVEVDADYTCDADDFLAPFRQRLVDNLTARALAALVETDRFDAGPWEIGLDGLHHKLTHTRIPLAAIDSVAWQDGRLHVWANESDRAILRLEADEENSLLLAPVIGQLLGWPSEHLTAPRGDAGRQIFEFCDRSFRLQVVLGVMAASCLFFAATALRMWLAGDKFVATALGLASGADLVAAGVVYFLLARPKRLLLSENELSLESRGATTIVPLDRLAEFSAEWVDYLRDGVYQATCIKFVFFTDEPDSKKVVYESQASFDTPKYADLQTFQSRIAETIANRLREELAREGRVDWTSRLTILPKGLAFTKRGDEPRTIPLSSITHWEVDQGLFKLAIDGQQRPDIVEKSSQANFFPGLLLFEELTAQAESKSLEITRR